MLKTNPFAFLILALVLIVPSIASAASGESSGKRIFADVLRVEVNKNGAGVYSFAATISSPDTGWKKYANAFRVKSDKGKVFGTRILVHPHVDEQPFTRSLYGVKVPPDVREVIVDARDSVAGWGGKAVRVKLPR